MSWRAGAVRCTNRMMRTSLLKTWDCMAEDWNCRRRGLLCSRWAAPFICSFACVLSSYCKNGSLASVRNYQPVQNCFTMWTLSCPYAQGCSRLKDEKLICVRHGVISDFVLLLALPTLWRTFLNRLLGTDVCCCFVGSTECSELRATAM